MSKDIERTLRVNSLDLPSLNEPMLFEVEKYKWELHPPQEYSDSTTAVAALTARSTVFGFELLKFTWVADEADLKIHGSVETWQDYIKAAFSETLKMKAQDVVTKKIDLASRLAIMANMKKDQDMMKRIKR